MWILGLKRVILVDGFSSQGFTEARWNYKNVINSTPVRRSPKICPSS